MKPSIPILQLHDDNWSECFESSLMALRVSWQHQWIGLPAVLQVCCDFLELQPILLSDAAQAMLAAANELSHYTEQRCEKTSADEEPKYHNRLHTADVIVTMTLQLAIEAKLSGLHDKDWISAGLLTAVAHDFMHSGGVNQAESQIEKLSCLFMRPVLEKRGVSAVWIERIETAIVRSDFSLAAQNHEKVSDKPFAWHQDWLTVLLNEADILPSSVSAFGHELSDALAHEWMMIGFAQHQTVATDEGRLAFLNSLIFSSPSSKVLGAPEKLRAQLAH
jgi:hypothetical protein